MPAPIPGERRGPPALLLPALAVNLLIASGTFLVAKRTLIEFPALPLTMLRFALATAILVPIARLAEPAVTIRPGDRGRIAWLGVFGVVLNQGLFLIGMQWSSASHAALLYALTPTFVLMVNARIHRQPPTLRQIVGIALSFLGVVTLLIQRGLHIDRHSVAGDLIVLCAVAAWGLYLVLGRDMTRRYGPLAVTSRAHVAAVLVFLPIGIFGLMRFHPALVSPAGWTGLLYLAIGTSAINYVILFWAVRYMKPATVALMTNLQPIVTVAMARVFLNEPLPAGFVVSTALVLGGVWLTQTGAGAKPLENRDARG